VDQCAHHEPDMGRHPLSASGEAGTFRDHLCTMTGRYSVIYTSSKEKLQACTPFKGN
jgi:hypothetical protein